MFFVFDRGGTSSKLLVTLLQFISIYFQLPRNTASFGTAGVLTPTLFGFVLPVSVYLHVHSNSDISSNSIGSFAFCSLNRTGDKLPSSVLFHSSITCRYESISVLCVV